MASLRSSGAREGEGATIGQSLPGARAEGESKARGALWLCSSRALEAKENGEAREAGSGRRIEHPQVVCVPVDALQERLSAVLVSEEEGGRERRGLREEDRHSHREARLCCVDRSRGAALLISGEGGSGMDAALPHGKEASTAEERRFGVVIKGEEGHLFESLRDSEGARGDRSAEELREESGLFWGDESLEPRLVPWELLRSVETESEGEAETPGFAIGEAGSP